MSTDALERSVAAIAARIIGQQPGRDEPLPFDSLSHAELVFALEEELAVRLPDQVSLRTLAEATDAVERARGNGGSGAPLHEGIGHLQWLAAGALRPILGPYYRFSVTGADRIPDRGPVVLVSNHDSLLDIPFLAIAAPRRVWFMAKRELFEKRFGAWFFHVLGAFPVDRGRNDLKALRAALATIEQGRALAMYPEGTRSREFLPFLPGAAWGALATGAPLVPVAVRGTAESMPRGSVFPRRSRVSVAFGEPVEPGLERDPRRRLERAAKLTVELRGAVERLRWP
ncbi:MAG TPA: 1-acyl-sn-glycerol-3-phosphate acyltransferase [Actinomycetota bacterium]|nr:1-acyl-sn-glycerol-3-phosphate acyltransferase [Actinomycetota bacterium]